MGDEMSQISFISRKEPILTSNGVVSQASSIEATSISP